MDKIRSAKLKGGIWEEHYPLLPPQSSMRSSLPISNFFSADVVNAYKDAVQAFLITLFSLVTLALTGLNFCRLFSLGSLWIAFFRIMWLSSPAVAAIALRRIAATHLKKQNYNAMAFPMWEVPRITDLFRCYSNTTLIRLLLLSYCIPLFCQVAAYTLTAATRVINPVGTLHDIA